MPCEHGYPLAVVSVDVVVVPKLKIKPGYMVVDRYCDCLLCGPFKSRMEVVRDQPVRHGMVIQRYEQWIDQERKKSQQ